MSKNRSSCLISTWTSGSISIATTGGDVFGVIFSGSADLGTLTIKDGTDTKLVIQAATTATVPVVFCMPARFTTSITATNSGTGSYAVMYAVEV